MALSVELEKKGLVVMLREQDEALNSKDRSETNDQWRSVERDDELETDGAWRTRNARA